MEAKEFTTTPVLPGDKIISEKYKEHLREMIVTGVDFESGFYYVKAHNVSFTCHYSDVKQYINQT